VFQITEQLNMLDTKQSFWATYFILQRKIYFCRFPHSDCVEPIDAMFFFPPQKSVWLKRKLQIC